MIKEIIEEIKKYLNGKSIWQKIILSIKVLLVSFITLCFLTMCGYCTYNMTRDPIYDCGIVKEVGGCDTAKCRVILTDERIANVRRLIVPGEKACWVIGKK